MQWSDRGRAAGIAAAVVLFLVALPSTVLAATPVPTNAEVGDPRSSGQGPGLVGDPLAAILIVAAIAVLTVLATLAYVRLTSRRERASRS
jgi:hypothetical protein